MEDTHHTRPSYREARDAFDKLRIEDKAVFLLESAVHTVARGAEAAAHEVASALEDLFRKAEAAGEAAAEEAAAPPPDVPPPDVPPPPPGPSPTAPDVEPPTPTE